MICFPATTSCLHLSTFYFSPFAFEEIYVRCVFGVIERNVIYVSEYILVFSDCCLDFSRYSLHPLIEDVISDWLSDSDDDRSLGRLDALFYSSFCSEFFLS